MSGAAPFPPGTSGNPRGRRKGIKETAPRGAKALVNRLLAEYRRAGIDPVREAFTEALRDPRQRPAALGLVALCAPHVLAGPLARHFRTEFPVAMDDPHRCRALVRLAAQHAPEAFTRAMERYFELVAEHLDRRATERHGRTRGGP